MKLQPGQKLTIVADGMPVEVTLVAVEADILIVETADGRRVSLTRTSDEALKPPVES